MSDSKVPSEQTTADRSCEPAQAPTDQGQPGRDQIAQPTSGCQPANQEALSVNYTHTNFLLSRSSHPPHPTPAHSKTQFPSIPDDSTQVPVCVHCRVLPGNPNPCQRKIVRQRLLVVTRGTAPSQGYLLGLPKQMH